MDSEGVDAEILRVEELILERLRVLLLWQQKEPQLAAAGELDNRAEGVGVHVARADGARGSCDPELELVAGEVGVEFRHHILTARRPLETEGNRAPVCNC